MNSIYLSVKFYLNFNKQIIGLSSSFIFSTTGFNSDG